MHATHHCLLTRAALCVLLLSNIHGTTVRAEDANITARLARLERALEGRGLVDLLQQVESLQREIQRLQGQLEEQSYAIEQFREAQRDAYVDMDQRLGKIEQASGMAPPLTTLVPNSTDSIAGTPSAEELRRETQIPTLESQDDLRPDDRPSADQPSRDSPESVDDRIVTPSVVRSSSPAVDDETSENAYRDAFALLKAGKYEESIAAFTDFLQRYPNSQYADNAQYWLGETHYVNRDFNAAIAQYDKLIELFPDSKKRSHAMLKIGYSYHELGESEQARAVLEDLRRRYSDSAAARLAGERIERILAEHKPQ